jgi:hypothetical protein
LFSFIAFNLAQKGFDSYHAATMSLADMVAERVRQRITAGNPATPEMVTAYGSIIKALLRNYDLPLVAEVNQTTKTVHIHNPSAKADAAVTLLSERSPSNPQGRIIEVETFMSDLPGLNYPASYPHFCMGEDNGCLGGFDMEIQLK